jgi:archaellum biogenesis ATPase FlaH
MEQSKEYLKSLYEKHGDFKLHYMRNENNPVWIGWKPYSHCSEQERDEANLREIMLNEIILDIDNPDQLKEIENKLEKLGLSYTEWETGSRGFHIRLTFPALILCSEEQRKLIREYVIAEFGTDPTKKTGLIAIEYRPHFKTGNHKTLIKTVGKEHNELPPGVKIFLEGLKIITPCKPNIDSNASILQKLKESIPKGERNGLLFKLACSFRSRGGYGEEFIFTQIEAVNQAMCKPPLEKREIQTIVKSACKYEAGIPLADDTHIKSRIITGTSIISGEEPTFDYFIENVIPMGTVTLIGGRPGAFKSMLCLCSAISIALGKPFLNSNTKQNKNILYYDLENSDKALHSRIKYILRGTDANTTSIDGLNFCFDFNKNDMRKELALAMEYDIIYLDSFRRFLKGDENDSAVIDEFFKNFLKPLVDAKKTIIMVHHFRKRKLEDVDDDDIMESFRGSSDILAIIDVSYGLKVANETIQNNVTQFDVNLIKGKNRHGLPLKSIVFEVTKNDFHKTTSIKFKEYGFIDFHEALKQQILGIIIKNDGSATRRNIVKGIKSYSASSVDRTIREMIDDGNLQKIRAGMYGLTEDYRESNIYDNADKHSDNDKDDKHDNLLS